MTIVQTFPGELIFCTSESKSLGDGPFKRHICFVRAYTLTHISFGNRSAFSHRDNLYESDDLPRSARPPSVASWAGGRESPRLSADLGLSGALAPLQLHDWEDQR